MDTPAASPGPIEPGIDSARQQLPLASEADAMSGGTDRPRMRLVSFKQLPNRNGGALVGFANVELPSGLKINDCPVLISNGKAWAAFPAKPQIGQDGRQIVIDGKKQFTAILSWPDRATANRWSDAVVDLVRAKHPEAFDTEDVP